MKILLEDGADPNAQLGKKLWFRSFGDHSWVDTAGATAFWRAASSTDVAAMKLLVKHGADPGYSLDLRRRDAAPNGQQPGSAGVITTT